MHPTSKLLSPPRTPLHQVVLGRPLRALLAAAVTGAAAWLAGAPVAAQGTGSIVLSHVGTRVPKVEVGESRLFEVLVTRSGVPAVQFPVDFVVVSGPGASGPDNPRFTDTSGVASALFHFAAAGKVRIDVSNPGTNTITYNVTVGSDTGGGEPTPSAPASLQRVSPAQQTIVLGDNLDFEVRVLDAQGNPLAGVDLTWAVESTSNAPPLGLGTLRASDDAGVAKATFPFPATGQVVITASYPGAGSVRFDVTVQSLGTLTPDNRSYRSVGAAFDAICAEVFATATPDPTPLCVFMTGTLQTHTERTEAVAELTATGLGSQTTAAAAGLAQQLGAVASRLSALRGGALRQSLAQIAFSLDGGTVTDGLLASARAEAARRDAFDQRLDQRLLRLYAGMDAQEAPAAAPAPPVEPKRDRPWGLFVNGRLTQGERDQGVDETGFEFDTVGVTIGVDRAVGANSFFGAALSALDNETDLADAGGTLDTSGLALTLYGIWEVGDSFYVQATGTYGQNEYEQARRMELPVLGTLTARADFDGDQLAAQLEAGWSFDGPRGTATIFGRGNWARAEVDAFAERGAVGDIDGPGGFAPVDFGIAVEAQELTSLVGELGLDLSRVFQFGGGLFVPQLNASVLHEFDDDAQGIRGRFLGDLVAGSSFLLFTDEPDRDYFNLGASIRFQFLWGSLFVAYDRELERDDLDLQTVNAGLRFEL